MSEVSSGTVWMLRVWFERSDRFTEFYFDVKPEESGGTKVVSYNGEREGRPMRVNVTMDRVATWSLEEVSR